MFRTQNNIHVKNGKIINSRRNSETNVSSIVNLQRDALHEMAGVSETAATKETASMNDPSYGGYNPISVSAIGTGSIRNLDRMLSGIVDERNEYAMRTLYRDIYYNDVTCGSAVDLTSTLPFSDFSLTGLHESKIDIFMDSVSRLNLKTVMPLFSLGYLIDGIYLGTMVYDSTRKIFTDLLKHDVLNCHFQEMPFLNQDPIIKVNQSAELQHFLTSQDDIVVRQRRNYSPRLLRALSHPQFMLDPTTTIYLPRQSLNGRPNSYYRRVIPIYLLEKYLVRGTIVEASKRQRAALHVQAGSDSWEPMPEELQALVSLFQQADFDPLSPIIATRNDISLAEIRQGGDFWKWTDSSDEFNSMKLRAMGVSDSFLSGDQTYATAEANLSVYIENLKAYRDFMTQKIFYTHLFPIIAHVNDFKVSKKSKSSAGYVVTAGNENLMFNLNDNTKYEMPRIQWHKSLQPRNDHDTVDMLSTMAEKGVPVTIRAWAAAGGVDLSNILEEIEEDKKLRTKIAEKLGTGSNNGDNESNYSDDSGGYGDDNGNYDNDAGATASLIRGHKGFNNKMPSKPIGIMGRNYGETAEIVGTTKTGKKKYIPNQKKANKDANEQIARALNNLSDPNHYEEVVKQTKRGRRS